VKTVAVIAGVLFAAAWAEAAPQRVVSVSACVDQYVLALAGREQIAGLSWQKDHPLFDNPDWVSGKAIASADAERLLKLEPDLVVFGPGEGARARLMLERFGVETHEIGWTEDFDGVVANIDALGERLGADQAARTLTENLQHRRAMLESRAEARSLTPVSVYLTPAGGSAGTGTYVDAAIDLAGGENALRDRASWFTAPPELLQRAAADIVITSYFRDGYASYQQRRARHPAVSRLLEGPVVEVPGGLWPCAGPRLIEAAERIADGYDALAVD